MITHQIYRLTRSNELYKLIEIKRVRYHLQIYCPNLGLMETENFSLPSRLLSYVLLSLL